MADNTNEQRTLGFGPGWLWCTITLSKMVRFIACRAIFTFGRAIKLHFSWEKISNSILLSRLDNGLGYATFNVLKLFIYGKTMITNGR